MLAKCWETKMKKERLQVRLQVQNIFTKWLSIMVYRLFLHTDHAPKKKLPWIDGLLDEGEKYYKETGKPLFSSHMLDLSVEPLEDNISISKKYLKRMSKIVYVV